MNSSNFRVSEEILQRYADHGRPDSQWMAQEIFRLRAALKPFAALGGPQDGTPAFHDLEDDVVVHKDSGEAITAGDVRNARELLGLQGFAYDYVQRRAVETNSRLQGDERTTPAPITAATQAESAASPSGVPGVDPPGACLSPISARVYVFDQSEVQKGWPTHYVSMADYDSVRLSLRTERLRNGTGDPLSLVAQVGPWPMPTVTEAIEGHVRAIEVLCDAANLDPDEWFSISRG